jgi:hypothetical protein
MKRILIAIAALAVATSVHAEPVKQHCDSLKAITLSLMSAQALPMIVSTDKNVTYLIWTSHDGQYIYIITQNADDPGLRACITKSAIATVNSKVLSAIAVANEN